MHVDRASVIRCITWPLTSWQPIHARRQSPGITALSECIERWMRNMPIFTIPSLNAPHRPSTADQTIENCHVDDAISAPPLPSSLPPSSPLADTISETLTLWPLLPPPSPLRDIMPSPLSMINETGVMMISLQTLQLPSTDCEVSTSGDVCQCALNSAWRCRNCSLQSQQEICTTTTSCESRMPINTHSWLQLSRICCQFLHLGYMYNVCY